MKIPVRLSAASVLNSINVPPGILAIGWLIYILASGSSRADLVGHWKFDETTGTTAHDETGKLNAQLSESGATFVSNGVAGNAIRLDRSQSGFVRIPPIPGLVLSNFSVITWAKLLPEDTTEETYLLTAHEAWFSNGFLLMLNQVGGFGAPGKASFYLSNQSQTGTSATIINDGQWHQLALTYDPLGQTAFYVDGGGPEVSLSSAQNIDRFAPFLVGGVYGQDETGVSKGTLSGWVDDVQIYDQTLTATEIGQLFTNPGRNLQELVQPIGFSPKGGVFVSSIEVTLRSAIPGAVVRFTLDNSDPVVSSPLFSGPLTLTGTTTVKARLFLSDFPVSEVVTGQFTRVPPIDFEPAGGLFTNAVAVFLKNNLGVGSLAYTIDGSEPVVTSPSYEAAVTLTNATTLKAKVFVNGFPASEIASTRYERVYAVDDGLSNQWREQHFGTGFATDPRVAATADPDNDGWTNLLEFQNGTDPLDKLSYPAIVAGIRVVPSISWNSVPGLNYRILRKSRVDAARWEVIVPVFQATEVMSRYVDAEAPTTAIYLIERVL